MNNAISEYLLTQIINYGAPLFAFNLFLGALGFPVGASFVLIAIGAFSQQGYFSWIEMALFGLAGALLGDSLSFGIGYFCKDWARRKLGRSSAWNQANQHFLRNAWVAIFLTRFLITALAIPTNLIAGGSGYKYSRFMLYDFLGEFIWVFLYGSLGYLFGSRWEQVGEVVNDFGTLLLGIVILIAGIWLARNWLVHEKEKKNQPSVRPRTAH